MRNEDRKNSNDRGKPLTDRKSFRSARADLKKRNGYASESETGGHLAPPRVLLHAEYTKKLNSMRDRERPLSRYAAVQFCNEKRRCTHYCMDMCVCVPCIAHTKKSEGDDGDNNEMIHFLAHLSIKLPGVESKPVPRPARKRKRKSEKSRN